MNNYSFVLLLILTLFGATCPAGQGQTQVQTLRLERLDPHGKKTVDYKTLRLAQNTECLVCHLEKSGRIETKSKPDELCSSCHGKIPHSGVAEHMGKNLDKLKIGSLSGVVTCLSCHLPHRNGVRTNASPMLKFICTECHRWD